MNAIVHQMQSVVAADHSPDAMFRMAKAIADGRMFGSDDPNAVFTLMLVAQAEGKHPGRVMQDYHVINGKPAKKADAMLADFIASGGKVEWHALTDELADATFTHPFGGCVRISWDDARVSKAELGKNPMHKKYPRHMKRSRVISEGVRTVFPGATSGFYVPEEVVDFDEPKPVELRQTSRPPAPHAQRPQRALSATAEVEAGNEGPAAPPEESPLPDASEAIAALSAAIGRAAFPSDMEAIRRMTEWRIVRKYDPEAHDALAAEARRISETMESAQ